MATEIGMTLLYVRDVRKAADFYQKAFGIELDAGVPAEHAEVYAQTAGKTLGFASTDMMRAHVGDLAPVARDAQPPAMEVLFTVKNVDAAYERAIGAGALSLREPADKPWGQRVAYVRDTDGFVVELASPLMR